MKKISDPLLAAFLLMEMMVAISFVSQLEKYPQFWAVIGVLAVMAGVTAYFLAKNAVDYCTEQKSVRDMQLEQYMQETNSNNQRLFTMLADKFVEQNDKICITADESVKALGSTVQNEMENVLSDITTLLDKFSKQTDDTRSQMEQVIFDVKAALDDQITTVENRTSDMQNLTSEVFDKGMKEIHSFLAAVQTVFDRKLIDIHAEYEKMLADVKSELVRHTKDVSGAVSENTRILSDELNRYSENVSVNLQHIWNDSIEAMETSSKTLLTNTSEMLENRNLELMERHTDYSHERITEIADMYDRIMKDHIARLKNEIQESISGFVKVNRVAFEQNAKSVEKLVGTEEEFIGELTSNNERLNSTISRGFDQYTNAVIDMFCELEDRLAQNIADGTNVSREHISGISAHNKAAIEELAEKLRCYSDSLVDKSAEAIAAVQRDNNLKMQEMCESYVEFSRDSKAFAQNCYDSNLQTNASIERMICQNDRFLADLQQVSSNSVEEMNKVLDEYVDHMSQRVEALNVDNSKRYHDAMEHYRDVFVELNAEALANVQKDTLDAVSDAHIRLAELADNVRKTGQQMYSLGRALASVLDETKQIIEEGTQAASENQEMFHGNLETDISDMKTIFTTKLDEYNDAFDGLEKKISLVLNEIQINTESYNSTLKFIIDSQNAMNSLTSKDVQLLEKLIGG